MVIHSLALDTVKCVVTGKFGVTFTVAVVNCWDFGIVVRFVQVCRVEIINIILITVYLNPWLSGKLLSRTVFWWSEGTQ